MSLSKLPREVSRDTFPRFLAAARAGSVDARERLLESYRTYLRSVCVRKIPARLRGKVDPSDLVQETLHAAHQNFDNFESDTHSELQAWLTTLVNNRIVDGHRKFATAKRQVGREVPLDSGLTLLVDQYTRDYRRQRDEQDSDSPLARLKGAVERLTPKQHAVFLLRHDERLTFDKIGARLKISDVAARRLYQRAFIKLRTLLGPDTNES